MTDGLSAADVMALSRDDENNWMNNPGQMVNNGALSSDT